MTRVRAKCVVKLTAGFQRKIEQPEAQLQEANARRAFDQLVGNLLDTAIPNLQAFPDLGRPFLQRAIRSVEAANAVDKIRKKIRALDDACDLREYVLDEYLMLYAHLGDEVVLLSIRHQREISFDLESIWVAGP